MDEVMKMEETENKWEQATAGMTTSEICLKFQVQACFECEKLSCGDNTTAEAMVKREQMRDEFKREEWQAEQEEHLMAEWYDRRHRE